MNQKSFICTNCGKKVNLKAIGTRNRNHCPYCLWSKHVDDRKIGDRLSFCNGLMTPVGLTFKDKGADKYGKKRQGEVMIIHQCLKCGKITKNRLAGDDDPQVVLEIFDKSFLSDLPQQVKLEGINLLTEKDRAEIRKQLFGQ